MVNGALFLLIIQIFRNPIPAYTYMTWVQWECIKGILLKMNF